MCAVRFFLTGQPGIGKTTAIRIIISNLEKRGKKVGGMISSEIRNRGARVGFQLEDISLHKIGTLAHSQKFDDSSPTVGKYFVNLRDISRIGVTAIREAVNSADVIIIDEIGPMELKSEEFISAVEFALASQKRLIGSIHQSCTHTLIRSIKSTNTCALVEVNLRNRDRLPSEIVTKVLGQAV